MYRIVCIFINFFISIDKEISFKKKENYKRSKSIQIQKRKK